MWCQLKRTRIELIADAIIALLILIAVAIAILTSDDGVNASSRVGLWSSDSTVFEVPIFCDQNTGIDEPVVFYRPIRGDDTINRNMLNLWSCFEPRDGLWIGCIDSDGQVQLIICDRYFTPGDVNGDGEVGPVDLARIVDYLFSGATL